MSKECRDFVFVKTDNNPKAFYILSSKYNEIEQKEDGIRIYDESVSSNVSRFLYEQGIDVNEISFQKIGLEEYYLQIMSNRKEGK
jgi:hypothetical protein